MKHLNKDSIEQYQTEERTIMAFRVASSRYRLMELLNIMGRDQISTPEKTLQLRNELAEYLNHKAYTRCKTIGQVVKTHLKFCLQKNLKQIHKISDKFGD